MFKLQREWPSPGRKKRTVVGIAALLVLFASGAVAYDLTLTGDLSLANCVHATDGVLTIEGDSWVAPNHPTVLVRATEAVVIKSGFSAQAGAEDWPVFHAYLGECGVPEFEPSYWNIDTNIKNNNNCYNYANNNRTNSRAHPGSQSGCGWITSCAELLYCAGKDGLTPMEPLDDLETPCPGNEAKVAGVRIPGSGTDYHWYRLDANSNGQWSHKALNTDAINTDDSGNPIDDPKATTLAGLVGDYTEFCGYMCACSSAIQGEGMEAIE